MTYVLGDKKIRIPDDEIAHYAKTLGVSDEEAIEIWLEDEGYLDNEEQTALCQKAKDNRITATIHQAKSVKKKTQRERVKKDDPTKEGIILAVAKLLEDMATDVEIVNKSKLVTFKIGSDTYKLDLIRQRPPKK